MRDQEVFTDVAKLRNGAATLAYTMNPTLTSNPSLDASGATASGAPCLAN